MSEQPQGYYKAYLPTGEFTITLISPSIAWQTCLNEQTITFETTNEIQELNLFAKAEYDCPLLEVSINISANLRPCWDDRPIHIYYENVGTDTLYDGLIAVVLPVGLTYTHNSGGAFLSQPADTVFFAAQSPLAYGANNHFIVYVTIDCTVELGSTICARVLAPVQVRMKLGQVQVYAHQGVVQKMNSSFLCGTLAIIPCQNKAVILSFKTA